MKDSKDRPNDFEPVQQLPNLNEKKQSRHKRAKECAKECAKMKQ